MQEVLQTTPEADQEVEILNGACGHHSISWALGVLGSGWEQQGMAPWGRGSRAAMGAEKAKLLEEVTDRPEKYEQSYMLISWWKRLLQEGGTTALCSEPTPPPRIWWGELFLHIWEC